MKRRRTSPPRRCPRCRCVARAQATANGGWAQRENLGSICPSRLGAERAPRREAPAVGTRTANVVDQTISAGVDEVWGERRPFWARSQLDRQRAQKPEHGHPVPALAALGTYSVSATVDLLRSEARMIVLRHDPAGPAALTQKKKRRRTSPRRRCPRCRRVARRQAAAKARPETALRLSTASSKVACERCA